MSIPLWSARGMGATGILPQNTVALAARSAPFFCNRV